MDPEPGTWRGGLTAGLAAAVLALTFWTVALPERPLLPTSDLYTHLSVSRNLLRGEGFKTDIAYPLSFAFPFARELPQPLIHRQPGFSLLLTPVVWTTGMDPDRAPRAVFFLQMGLAALLVGSGTMLLWRRRRPARIGPWILLIVINPLFGFALQWGMVELVCSFLLYWAWIRSVGTPGSRPGPKDGVLAGSIALLRADLFWVPLFWWIVVRFEPGARDPSTPEATPRPWTRRVIVPAVAAWLLVLSPWLIRNARVTGSPFFSLQAQAEMVKDTPDWPGYSVYRGLEPQPMIRAFLDNPEPILRKTARGLHFFLRDGKSLMPYPLTAAALVMAFWFWGTAVRSRFTPGPPKRSKDAAKIRGAALAGTTLVLLAVQYSFFDHSLRHLIVLLPVLVWEMTRWFALEDVRFGRLGSDMSGPVRGLIAAALAVVFIFAFPCKLPGWNHAAAEAVKLRAATAQKVAAAEAAPPGPLFVDDGAVTWFADRPGVWWPLEEIDIQIIQSYLERDLGGRP